MELSFLFKLVLALLAFFAFIILWEFIKDPKAFKEAMRENENKSKKKKSIGSVDLGNGVKGEIVSIEVTETFSIKGLNFHDLDESMVGPFKGYVKIQRNNKYDRYAIGVYIDGEEVGHLPRGNKALFNKIAAKGGKVRATGFIDMGEDQEDGHLYFYGEVEVYDVN